MVKKLLSFLLIGLIFFTFIPAVVVAQPTPQPPTLPKPRLTSVTFPVLQQRPSLQLFLNLYRQHKNNLPAFRQALIAANIKAKVDRICYVFGGYSPQVQCKSLRAIYGEEFLLTPSDRAMLDLAFNDLFDALGGSATGGDLSVCGGSTIGSVTHVQTFRRTRVAAVTFPTTSGRGKAQELSASDETAMINNCRNAQKADIKAGLGLYRPGDPGYQRAVQSASSFLTSIAANCRDTGNSMVASPAAPPADGQTQLSAPGALAWVAGVTQNIAEAAVAAGEVMEGCSSKASCALSVVSAAVGLAANANDLQAVPNEALSTADTVLDVVGGIVAVVTEVGAAATTLEVSAMVLPAAAVGVTAYTVASPIGNAMAEVLDPAYISIADALAGVSMDKPTPPSKPSTTPGVSTDKPTPPSKPPTTPGGGVGMPAEDGKPTCSEIADRASRFNDYCSQEGNNWRTYDCMIFVARLNHCADPGLIRPAPGEDFTCSVSLSKQEQAIAACKQTEKLRGWLSSMGSGSSPSIFGFANFVSTGISTDVASKCDQMVLNKVDLEQQMQEQICERVLTDDPNVICSGIPPR